MIKQLTTLLTIWLTGFSLMACSDENDPELDISTFTIMDIEVNDVDNEGNPSDIEVSFAAPTSTASISEIRIFYSEVTSSSSFSPEFLASVPDLNFKAITNISSNTMVRLNDQQLDIDNNLMQDGKDYQIHILSIGKFDGTEVLAVSEPSPSFVPEVKPEVYTLVANLAANDAISVDDDGNIYVSEYGVYDFNTMQGTGGKVLKVTPSGDVSEFANNLKGPVGNAIDESGNLYVNNANNFVSGDLLKITSNGNRSVIATISGYSGGVLLGDDDNLYVSNYQKPVVSQISSEGLVTNFAEDALLAGGVGIAYDGNNIIIGNYITGNILSVDPDGGVELIAKLPTVTAQTVIGYITFYDGFVYATGNGAGIIYRISLNGEVTVFAGNGQRAYIDGELDKASFSRPNGIAVDKNRKLLYVTDARTDGTAALRVIPLD